MVQGKELAVTAKLANLPSDKLLKKISFTLVYDENVFENPSVTVKDGVEGSITTAETEGKTVYTFTNEAGISVDVKEFAVITLKTKAEAETGTYTMALADVAAEDVDGAAVNVKVSSVDVTVKERPITGEVTYLSNLEWVIGESAWESVEKDKYCNGASSDQISLNVDGERTYFEKGLGANAVSTIVYDLSSLKAQLEEGEKLYFQSYVGVDYFKTAKKQNGNGMYFIVYDGEVVDGQIVGTELYHSGLLDSYSEAEHISLDITSLEKNLILYMDPNGSNSHDNGDWADAKVIKVPDPNAADKTELKAALDTAKGLNEADYTVETYAALKAAIEAAEAVYADKKAAQEQVDAQVESLKAAVSGLKVPGAQEYQDLLKQLQEKEKDLAEKESQLSAKEEEIRDQQNIIDELEKQLKEAKDSVTDLQEQLDAAKARVIALEAEKAELIVQVENAKKEIASLKADSDKEREELQKLQKEKAEAEEALKKAQEELAKLKAEMALKTGDTITVGNVKYRVTDAEKKLAEAYGVTTKSAVSVKVAADVTIKNVTVKVTAVADNAFKGMTKLKKAVIGKNVVSIGSKAFYGDKNLKTIQIKGRNLKTVGKSALKNISAKAVIKVPASKKKAYTKVLKNKGQKKTVKIK